MPNPQKGFGQKELKERMVTMGMAMTAAGFKPMTVDEITDLMKTIDGGATPIIKTQKGKGAIDSRNLEEGQVYRDFITQGGIASADMRRGAQGRQRQEFDRNTFRGSRKAIG